MVVSMETRKIPEKLRQEFSEIDEFGTQISKTIWINFLGSKSVNSHHKFDNAFATKNNY